MTSGAATCCAEFYELDWVATLLGDSFHPGGIALTRRTLLAMALDPGSHVVDLACGAGTTAVELAAQGHRVTAVDLGAKNLQRARLAATEAGLQDRVTPLHADVRRMPLPDRSVDAVICECAISTFRDKAAVVAELARVLRPGGRIGISDMVVSGPLPEALTEFAGPWACLSDALGREGYRQLFEDHGFVQRTYTDESSTLLAMALEVKRKLVTIGVAQLAGLRSPGLDLAAARELIALAQRAVRDATLGYASMSFA